MPLPGGRWPATSGRAPRLLGYAIAVVLATGLGAVAVRAPLFPASAAYRAPVAAASRPTLLPPPVRLPLPLPAPTRRPTATTRRSITVPTANRLSNSWGVDVSWPQCGPDGMPRVQPGFVVVGLNDGRPFTDNPCLARELAFARSQTGYAAYLNVDAATGGDPTSYGQQLALDGLTRAARAHLVTPVVWLDVEIANHWADPATNVAVLRAAVLTFRAHGVTAGIYSSGPMWQQITGGAAPGVPVWLATTVTDYRVLPTWCAQGLANQPAVMAQYVATDGTQLVDVNVLCPRDLPGSVALFSPGHS